MKQGRSETRRRFLVGVAAGVLLGGGLWAAEEPGKLILAHYMPWYASKEISGAWGWHWTMGHFNPDLILGDGRRPAASQDYPLLGLYDSSDPHLLETHVLLMKLAGIDGVIVDWYGTADFNDYAPIHRNTARLHSQVKRAGLRFTICYEDQAVKHRIAGKALPPQDALEAGRKDLRWIEEQCFGDGSCVRLDGKPVLLVFGPQHFRREEWDALRAGFKVQPKLFALPHLTGSAGADGVFGWPPVSEGRHLTPEEWGKELDLLYARSETVMGVAFPGYHDIYEQAGLHGSYGFIDARNGQTLAETLDRALASEARLIQIATWNDHGEGTAIEPSRDWGYRRLETIQERSRQLRGHPFSAADLRLPVLLYELRKRAAGTEGALSELDRAAALLFEGSCREARAVLDFQRATERPRAIATEVPE